MFGTRINAHILALQGGFRRRCCCLALPSDHTDALSVCSPDVVMTSSSPKLGLALGHQIAELQVVDLVGQDEVVERQSAFMS